MTKIWRESMEEGLLSTSLLLGQNGNVINDTSTSAAMKTTVMVRRRRLSVTFVLVLSTFVAACASFTYGCTAGYSSPAESGIVADLVFGSILTIGGMIGAVTSGKIADFMGRRRTMWFSEIFCIMGWFAVAFAKLMICFGFSLMYFLGSNVSWRILAIIGSIPCFIQIVGLFFIPESPRWLAKIGREKEFQAALQRLRGKMADISQEAADIKVGVGLMILQQFGGSNAIAFYVYVNDIFELADFSSSFGSKAIAIIEIPATILGVLLIDKSGR